MEADLDHYYNGKELADYYRWRRGERNPALRGKWPSLRALSSRVFHAPPDAAWRRAVKGEDADWNHATQLFAHIADLLAVANWQRSEDGEKGRNMPAQIDRPGVAKRAEGTRHGSTVRSLSDVKAWMSQWAPKAEGEDNSDGA